MMNRAPAHKKARDRRGLGLVLVFTLTLTVLVTSFFGVTTPATTGAVFTASSANGANTFTAAVLQPPTNVTAASSGANVVLNWTATTSTQATGYYIHRSSSAGVEGARVATLANRATTTWTDTDPLVGANYYTIKTYRSNWLSGTVQSSPVTPPPVTVSDNFNGSGVPGNTEVGGKTWTSINGTWTRNGAGFLATTAAITANPMVVTDMKTPNASVTVGTTVGSGEAAYLRVVDGANWLRARYRQNTYSYTAYETEYERFNYATEYQYEDYIFEQYWAVASQQPVFEFTKKQWQVARVDMGEWANTSAATRCQASAPASENLYGTGANSWMETNRRWYEVTANPCGNNPRWRQEERSTFIFGYLWKDDNNADLAGRNFYTGETRFIGTGETYVDYAKRDPNHIDLGRTELLIEGEFYWAVSPRDGDDPRWGPGVAEFERKVTTGTFYYATAPRDSYDVATGASRQVVTGSYWNTTPCAGCNTRQGAAYTAYATDYFIVLESSSAGVITVINSWAVPASSSLRMTASGNTINVYRNNTVLVGTATTALHNTATRHGVGLGGSNTTNPSNRVDYTTITTL